MATYEETEVLYHGSRPDVREQILREGLRPSLPGMAENVVGVYLTASFDQALAYGSGEPVNPEIADVWEVDAVEVEVERDKVDWRGWVSVAPIPPSCLRLVHAGSMTWAEWQERGTAA